MRDRKKPRDLHGAFRTKSGSFFRLSELDEHFRVSADSFVELLVRLRSVVNPNVMTYDRARLGAPVHNQITQVFVITFDWSLPGPKAQSLVEEIRESTTQSPFFMLVTASPTSSITPMIS